MNAKDSDGGAALLPGLPNEVVLFYVITRLPWYARPVCRAVSKSWRGWIDTSTKRREILIKSREHLLPLLQAHFLVCTFDHHTFIDEASHGPRQERRSGYHCVQWRDKTYQICRQWRELPSLQNFFPQPPLTLTLMATDGMVYAWASGKPQKFILKMDMAAGHWTWKKLHVPSSLNYLAVPFKGKIYVPGVSAKGKSATGEEREMMVEHDMTTEECGLVKTLNRYNLRVLRNKISESSGGICEEELYSIVEHTAESKSGSNLEILVYDACNDSWTTKVMLPIPECKWSDMWDIKLVNGDCFEPAPDGGINTVWVDHEGSVLSWFNSSLHETWVEFEYNAFLEGKCLEYLEFMHGCLYGMFIEDEDDEDGVEEETKDGRAEDRENKKDPTLFKRTIMKGKMVVETSNVQWEEVLDIGCFQESYYIQPAMVSPVDDYTLMV